MMIMTILISTWKLTSNDERQMKDREWRPEPILMLKTFFFFS